MKKNLVIWLLVLLCGLGIVAGVQVFMGRDAGQVEITEHVLQGDPSLAQGLTLRVRSQYRDYLTWDTTFLVGQEELARTEYAYLSAKEQEQKQRQEQVQLYKTDVSRIRMEPIMSNSVIGGMVGSIEELAKRSQGAAQLQDILKEAEALCEPGKELVKTFWLKDYYTYYPFYMELSDHNALLGIRRQGEVYFPADYSEWETILSQEMQKYFRIPIVEDHRLTVTVKKDGNGDIIDLGINGSNVEAGVSSTMTDTGIYFILQMSPEKYDFSQVPGGYGIYHLPVVEVEGQLCVVPEEMSTVCSLDKEWKPAGLWDDESGETLILMTQEGEEKTPMFHVVDMDTMETVQRLGYGISPEWDDYSMGPMLSDVTVKDHFMVVEFYDNSFLVYGMTEKGTYEFRFASETYIPEGVMAERLGVGLPLRFTASDMDYNGEYLAVTGFVPVSENRGLPSCDVYLVLYGAEGVAYYGVYQNSLSAGVDEDGYLYWCEPDGIDALTIAWSE